MTSTTRRGAQQRGIELHVVERLDPADVTTVEGIPATTVARTLVDLASVVNGQALTKALNEAEMQRTFDLKAIDEAAKRVSHRPNLGHANLRRALAELAQHGTTVTRSALEVAFQRLIGDAGLPRPTANAHLHGYEVDALWPADRLVVELDGWASHRTRRAFERDRTKDATLTTAGYTVLRFTHQQVTRQPGWVAETLGAALRPRPAAMPAAPATAR